MALRIPGTNPVIGKVISIAVIVLALMIPLSMLRGLISERMQMRDQAHQTVASGWGGQLTAGGPMLRVPFDTSSKSSNGEVELTRHQLYILPTELNVEARLDKQAEPRRVGIYEVPVYLVHLTLTGFFKDDAVSSAAHYGGSYRWDEAAVSLPLSDVRSVRELKSADFVGRALKFGPAMAGCYSGVEAKADLSNPPTDKLSFSIEVTLAGSDAIAILPLASVTRATMKSNWPHPQFQGAFLPAEYSIDTDGFSAKWQVLELNRAFSQSWKDDAVDESKLQAASFGVGLFQSVDVYQRSERAVKYALMFIALTFLSFYAWELLNAAAIHPMQYLLVGLALSTFYLLLIALTEHLAFWLAYWLGATALVTLLGVYIAGALGSRRRGLIIATLMTLVYGLLYLLVLSESYSLLMGAIALFAALAAVMLATRHVRWYAHNG